MLAQGLQKNSYWIVYILTLSLVALATIIFLFGTAEASRRVVTMKEMMVRQRKVEINGKLFDIEVNHTRKSITVRGYVEDWDEMDRVEKYFELKSPSDYRVTCELDFAY